MNIYATSCMVANIYSATTCVAYSGGEPAALTFGGDWKLINCQYCGSIPDRNTTTNKCENCGGPCQ